MASKIQKIPSRPTERLLDQHDTLEMLSTVGKRRELGKPSRAHRLSTQDYLALASVLIAFVIAGVAVLHEPSALKLGQTNQLVVVGLMLSIMGFSTQRVVQKVALLYELRLGRATLQNFDAILRNEHFSREASVRPRAILLFLFALPLALSASYKQFIGGSTRFAVPSSNIMFGFTGPPGYQLIGNGLSLMMNIYLPFWTAPAIDRTYGFNLYIADNSTAAALDAPMPNDLTRLQTSLKLGQSLLLTTRVMATVTESVNPPGSEVSNQAYWDDLAKSFDVNGKSSTDNAVHRDMWAGQNSTSNYTLILLSIWKDGEESFAEKAHHFKTTRRTCIGTWNITRQNTTLLSVTDLQTAAESTSNQSPVENGRLGLNLFFNSMIPEFDWRTRSDYMQPLPDSSPDDTKFSPTINTQSALVAAMVWARITSVRGWERPERPDVVPRNQIAYPIPSSGITMIRQSTTLKRSPWLIIILVIQPLLTILATMIKALLYTTPIGDGFGLISLLAGIREEGLAQLRGAALSRKLSRDVTIRFSARNGVDYDRLGFELDSHDRSHRFRLDPRKRYG